MMAYVAVIVGSLWAAEPLRDEKIPNAPQDPVRFWAELLTSEKPQVRLQAMAALGEIGPGAKAAVPALLDSLKKDKDNRVRRTAVIALGRIGPDAHAAVLPLVEVLLDDGKEYDLASAAARSLGQIGAKAKAAVPALTRALRSGYSSVSYAAAGALGAIGPDAKEAVPALLPLLTSVTPSTAAMAAESLWRIDRHPAAIPELIKQLRNQTPTNDGCPAAEALGRIGPGAKDAVAALREVLKVEQSLLPTRAAVTLWQIGKHTEGIPVMMDLLRHAPSSTIRAHAATALGLIGPAAKAAVPALTEALKDTGHWVAPSAAEALKRIAPDLATKRGGS